MCVPLSSQRSSCISVCFVARDDSACVVEPASRFERSSCEVDPPRTATTVFSTTRLLTARILDFLCGEQPELLFVSAMRSIVLVHLVIVFQVYFPRWAVQVNENYVTLIYDVFRSIVDRKIMLGTSRISRMLEVRLGKRVSY